jgi:hypothetical protein
MVLLTSKVIEFCLKTLLFLILLIMYYVFYMQIALDQYNEGRTTMAESIKPGNEHEYPVLIFCPEPGFKPSFFKEIDNKAKITSIDKYIWKVARYKKLVLSNVSSIPDVYMNMSYILEENWTIYLMPYSVMDSVKRY